eukprot:sb/3471665/
MFLCRSSKAVSTNGDQLQSDQDQHYGEEWVPGSVAYTFYIRTGFVYPQLGATRKWDDGTMVLVVNPGSEDSESQELRVNRTFHTDTEWATIADFWLPEHIGEPKLLKIRLESHRFEVIKEELYVKEISVRYNRKSYRYTCDIITVVLSVASSLRNICTSFADRVESLAKCRSTLVLVCRP